MLKRTHIQRRISLSALFIVATVSVANCQIPSATGPSSRASETVTIQGTVVAAQGRIPLPGIGVVLFTGQASTRTDKEGRFTFQAVRRRRLHVVGISQGTGYYAKMTPVRVMDGSSSGTVEIQALKAASVSGRVLDSKRLPRSRVRISLIEGFGASRRYPPVIKGIAVSDDRGRFRLADVPPGRYAIMAEPQLASRRIAPLTEQGLQRAPLPVDGLVPTFHPSSPVIDGANWLNVSGGTEYDNVDITMADGPTSCALYRSTSAAFEVVSVHSTLVFGGTPITESQLVKGPFQVCGLSAGLYQLHFSSTGFSGSPQHAVAEVAITRGAVNIPAVTLKPLLPLDGSLRIEPESKEGSTGPVQVLLESVDRPGLRGEQPFATVSSSGTFHVPAVVSNSTYWLRVRLPRGLYLKSATVAGRNVISEGFTVHGGSLELVVGSDGPSLSVTVADGEGQPLPWTVVVAGRDLEARELAPSDIAVGVTDEAGTVTLSGVAPGDYRVVALKDVSDSAALSPDTFILNRGQGQALTLRRGETRSLQTVVRELQVR